MRGIKSKFPTTFASVDETLLMQAYESGPHRLRQAVRGLTAEEWDATLIEGKWSINQILLHVADSELMGSTRIRLVLAADAPPLTGYNQDVWAEQLKYSPLDTGRLQSAVALFTELRATNAWLFRHAQREDWRRIGTHAEHGPVTLRNLLELYADHSERHIEQIYAQRALLGHRVKFKRLLPALLY